MRLTLSLLGASALHGAAFAVAAVVLSHGSAKDAVPLAAEVAVEVEVIPPRPDPIADTVPASVTAAPSNLQSAVVRPRIVRRTREVALLGNQAPTPAPAVPSALAVSTAAPSLSSAAATAAAVRVPQPGGGGAVSAKPRYRSNPTPAYPIPSKRRREEGVVLLNVQVSADGTPAAVSLNRSCGHPLLDRAALEAVRRWTFEPARAADLPVSSLVVIPVRFSLDDL
jgi:protein TonB